MNIPKTGIVRRALQAVWAWLQTVVPPLLAKIEISRKPGPDVRPK